MSFDHANVNNGSVALTEKYNVKIQLYFGWEYFFLIRLIFLSHMKNNRFRNSTYRGTVMSTHNHTKWFFTDITNIIIGFIL